MHVLMAVTRLQVVQFGSPDLGIFISGRLSQGQWQIPLEMVWDPPLRESCALGPLQRSAIHLAFCE